MKSIAFGQQKNLQITNKPQCLPSITAEAKHAVRDTTGAANVAPALYSRTPSQANPFKSTN